VLLAAALAVGALAGIIAGMTGIGGGVFMVPFLYLVYERLQVPVADATILAHATSLAVIVPTALRGLHGYRGLGLVRFRSALPLALFAAISAAATATVASRLPAAVLRVGFGAFLIVVAYDLLLRPGAEVRLARDGVRHTALAALLGIPVGALSAALGVGGGIPATIGMHYVLAVPVAALAPTALVVTATTAAAGTVGYLLAPSPQASIPGLVGHVDLARALPLAVGAVLAAPVGVRFNRAASARTLQRVLGLLLLALGLYIFVSHV
jgi:uncharacterized membrane protein YfcA